MRVVLIGIVWAATVGAAWFLGSSETPIVDSGVTRAAPTTVGGTSDADERAGPSLSAAPAGIRRDPASVQPGAPSPTPGGSSAATAQEFTLEGVVTAEEASRRLMAHVAALLAKGREGHLELVRFIDEQLLKNEELERLFGNDEAAARFVYPWLRFLVHHEGEVVALTETLYETMATNPSAFEGMDDNALEIFTEGISMALPGAVDEKRLGKFREYARAILDAPEESQPDAVRKNRSEIERVLAMWAPPLGPDEALKRLQSGEATGKEALALLRRLPPEALGELDVAPILVPLIQQGEWRAIQALGSLDLEPAVLDVIDRGVVDGALNGRMHDWHVRRYLDATKRRAWPAAQTLIESGLASGGKAVNVFAEVLMYLDPRPDASYVSWALDAYPIDESMKARIRSAFGLN